MVCLWLRHKFSLNQQIALNGKSFVNKYEHKSWSTYNYLMIGFSQKKHIDNRIRVQPPITRVKTNLIQFKESYSGLAYGFDTSFHQWVDRSERILRCKSIWAQLMIYMYVLDDWHLTKIHRHTNLHTQSDHTDENQNYSTQWTNLFCLWFWHKNTNLPNNA